MNLLKYFRRRRRTHFAKHLSSDSRRNIRRLIILVIIILILHTFAMMLFEGLGFSDALWLSLTTINTTGYGDLSSSSIWGRASTTILMYIFGISVMAQLAGEYIEHLIGKKVRKIRGQWSWNDMRNHIVIINTPKLNANLYLKRLVRQVRETEDLKDLPVCIITDRYPEGLPSDLRSLEVVHVHGTGSNIDDLKRASIDDAQHIVLLSNNSIDPLSDSLTLDILLRLQEFNLNARIITEAVLDENRNRFAKMGADAVIRPVRAYPEMVVRSLHAEGSEKILENLFSNEGDHVIKINMNVEAKDWISIVTYCLSSGYGTALAYEDHQNKVRTNPAPKAPVSGTAIYILVDHKHIPNTNEVSVNLSNQFKD